VGDGFPRQKDKEEVKNDKVVVKLKKIETEEIVNKKVKEIVNKKVKEIVNKKVKEIVNKKVKEIVNKKVIKSIKYIT